MNKNSQPQFSVFAKRRNQKEPVCNLYLKISFDGNVHEKSLGIKCLYEDWDSEKQSVKNHPIQSAQLDQNLEEAKQRIMGAYYLMQRQDSPFSLSDIVQIATGDRKPDSLSFLQCFADVITRMEKFKGLEGNSEVNLQKHNRCLDHLKNFLFSYYKCSDISFHKINRSFLDELSEYLKSVGNCSHNTAMKYMQIIKKIYRIGMDNGWVKINAFSNFKFKIKVLARDYLTEEELEKIRRTDFGIERLDYVKDLFLFSCFTGLAYIDIKNLKRNNLITLNNRFWIKSKRTKTGVEAPIPLLQPARLILEKYNPGWQVLSREEFIFRVISNQKLNAYLKEIAQICRIDKIITFHLARHTFATTVTLCNR